MICIVSMCYVCGLTILYSRLSPIKIYLKLLIMMKTALFTFLSIYLLTASSALYVRLIPPGAATAYLGGSTVFQCLVNNNSSNSQTEPAVDFTKNGSKIFCTDTCRKAPGGTKYLTLHNLTLESNKTIIGCNATLGALTSSSEGSRLLIQGLLQAVTSVMTTIHFDVVEVTWQAPYSLSIRNTNIYNNITYCINISRCSNTNRRCEQNTSSLCGINTTFATLARSTYFENLACFFFNTTVTPVNPVGMGKSTSKYVQISRSPDLQAILRGDTSYKLAMSAPVCSAELRFVDVDTGDMGYFNVTVAETNITFSAQQLRENRHYTVIINASNVYGQNLANATISTHDLEAVRIENKTIITNFFPHTNCFGAILIFWNEGYNKIAILAVARNSTHTQLPFDLYEGNTTILAYDIEQNGAVSTGKVFPASISQFDTTTTAHDPTYQFSKVSDRCTVSTSALAINVQCKIHIRNYTSGFYVIIIKLGSHKVISEQIIDSFSPVTISVEEEGKYLVSIFRIRRIGEGEHREIIEVATESSIKAIIVSTCLSALVVLLIAGSLLLIEYKFKCVRKKGYRYNEKKPTQVTESVQPGTLIATSGDTSIQLRSMHHIQETNFLPKKHDLRRNVAHSTQESMPGRQVKRGNISNTDSVERMQDSDGPKCFREPDLETMN